MSIFETDEFCHLTTAVAHEDEGAADRLRSFLWAIGFDAQALAAFDGQVAKLEGVSPYVDAQARHLREFCEETAVALDVLGVRF